MQFIQGERVVYFRPHGPARKIDAVFQRYTGKVRAVVKLVKDDGELTEERIVMRELIERPRVDPTAGVNAAAYAQKAFGYSR